MLTILKHAKSFVGDKSGKPIFQGVHFSGNEISVTNGLVLVFRTNYPSEIRTIHHKTGTPIEGTYPDVSKCIPADSKIKIYFDDLGYWINALKICMLVTKGSSIHPCSLESDGGFLKLRSKGQGIYTAAPLVTYTRGELLDKISFSAKYLHDVLLFFKDSGVKIVTMGFNTALSPITLTTDKDALAVLTPIRI